MLTHNPLIAFIPTKDTKRARRFYEDLLGLRFISDDSFAIVMDANGTMVRIVRVEDFTPFPFTILGWQVTDIHKTVAEMTGKGSSSHATLPSSKAPTASGPLPTAPRSHGSPTPTATPSRISQH